MATPNKGLGRGLGSLIPNIRENKDLNKTLKIDTPFNGGLLELPVDQISSNPKQPRHHFGHQEMEELTESIKQFGVLSPIIVTKVGKDKYELIAGERRWRASQLAELKTIPAILRDFKEQEKLEVAIIENIQRKNLNPIEEARYYQRLAEEFDLTHEQFAEKLSKSRSQISNTIRLLSLPLEVQDALSGEKISMGHAKIILGEENPQKQLDLYRKILVNNLTVRDSEKLTKQRKPQKTGVQKERDPLLETMENLLREALGTKVNIDKKGAKGKISIEFYSNEDLDSLVQKISG